jgi:hypothetical protein
MPLDPTETRTFDVLEVGDMIRSPKGHSSIECRTDVGTVAFWGNKSTSNLKALLRRQPPFRVRCGCRQPLPNYPTHVWWVPENSQIEFLNERASREEPPEEATSPPPRPTLVSLPAASPFRALAREDTALYVVGATKATIWDDDATGQINAYVPALYAYRGRSVKEWLASTQRAQAAHWLFLSPRYGFIEPDHPVGRHEGTFSERSISDDALRVQVEHQRRWNDRVALRDFQTVHLWSETTGCEEKARTAFELIGARVVRLKALTRAK